ncbi:MAG TPA: glycosyltransferase family 39 protein [Blastocatellia bacterium]|nr:glycosyltransferase family 39 protein [Blastocatellia bacterium]
MMKFRYLDFAAFGLVLAGFLFVAGQRLGTVPVPEGDEAFTLQVPYEMLYRGKLALPMLRYLGGNIENVWHSFIPLYFVLLTGFHKLFGFGLVQGRMFNLITAALTLLMVYLIGRRLFDWRAGITSVILLIGDQTFLERSRLLRSDYAAAAFALLAYYLYELAEQRKSNRFYIASGLAAGAGVMCHTNILYMVGAICLLILMREGGRALKSKKLYMFAGAAFAVMAYEIVYDLIDYKNFMLQNRGDDVHFRILTRAGLWQNLVEERTRYARWYAGGVMFPDLSQVTLRVFQILTVAAILYLIVVSMRRIKRGDFLSDPRARVFVVTTVVVLFHALIVSHKRIYYLAHLAPWFALCVGVMLRDGLDQISRLRRSSWPRAQLAWRVAMIFVTIAAGAYLVQLSRQGREFVLMVLNPNLASFEEFTTVIRSIVPEGLCPVALKSPSVWLAFPESDRCFATIESRMRNAVDIEGKDYALVTRFNAVPEQAQRIDSGEESSERYHLLGEMRDTPYGNLLIYYTGRDPRYLAFPTERYRFFGEHRGHAVLPPGLVPKRQKD